jgi:hypothetical protein
MHPDSKSKIPTNLISVIMPVRRSQTIQYSPYFAVKTDPRTSAHGWDTLFPVAEPKTRVELPEASPGAPPAKLPPPEPLSSGVYKLPLTLAIKTLRRTPDAVEVGALITDAAGVSVRFMPITMGPKTSPAEICAIMQSTVSSLAIGMYNRKLLSQVPPVSLARNSFLHSLRQR